MGSKHRKHILKPNVKRLAVACDALYFHHTEHLGDVSILVYFKIQNSTKLLLPAFVLKPKMRHCVYNAGVTTNRAVWQLHFTATFSQLIESLNTPGSEAEVLSHCAPVDTCNVSSRYSYVTSPVKRSKWSLESPLMHLHMSVTSDPIVLFVAAALSFLMNPQSLHTFFRHENRFHNPVR